MHTPTLDATKWWPGELGVTANYAIVMARCIIPEDDGSVNDYGVQPFLLQIRDLDTHKHMPGVKSGEIGPKFGYQNKDNGWMTLDKVRVPRSMMLQRFVKIDRDGSVSLNDDPKIMYSVMMNTRVEIILGTKYQYAYLLTIAMRYSVVRRQFKNISGQK
jgi:acyl-CoA oxidase